MAMFNSIRRFFSSAGYVYEPAASHCESNAPHSGTVAIMDQLLARVKGTTNLGLYNCRRIHGSSSLSLHAAWRAGDTGCPSQSQETTQGIAVVGLLMLHAQDLQIQEIIHARRRWQVGKGWESYSGPDPHWNHVHWSVTHVGAAYSAAYVNSVFAKGDYHPPPPIVLDEGEEMIITCTDTNQSYTATGSEFVAGGLDTNVLAQLRKAGIKEIHISSTEMKKNFGRKQADIPN